MTNAQRNYGWVAVMIAATLVMLAAVAVPGQRLTGAHHSFANEGRLTPASYSVLYNFSGAPNDGAVPVSMLTVDPTGNLYGTTESGGAYGTGTAFEVPVTGGDIVLHSFGGRNGNIPTEGLVRDEAGNLYGTTLWGGNTAGICPRNASGCGVVFKLSPDGRESVLYNFTGGADGAYPSGSLIRDTEGNLYGTAAEGGDLTGVCAPFGCGVVFKVSSAGEESVLHAFTGGSDGQTFPSPLVRDSAWNLYGTAWEGGNLTGVCAPLGCGVIYKLDRTGSETVLYSFTDGADGGGPSYFGPLALDNAGNLYGTTADGGDRSGCSPGCGVVFKVDPEGNETTLYTFSGGGDGASPAANVIRDAHGNLYGTTSEGGPRNYPCATAGCGVVFELTASGKETVLHGFHYSDGWSPYAGLLPYQGALYGTTEVGGSNSQGVVFKLIP